MQPAFMQAAMQSQHAWHIAQQSSSPLVQVKHTPSLVSVHSHLHMVKQQLQHMMPFIMQQQLHMLPASILHMFCSVAAATSSSQVQVILTPPLHFSIFIVHRGTMHICMGPGATAGMAPPAIDPGDPIWPIALLSMIIMLGIPKLLCLRPSRQAARLLRLSKARTSRQPLDRKRRLWTTPVSDTPLRG
jgi:hypothetical protein